jgi:hypothetical protein
VSDVAKTKVAEIENSETGNKFRVRLVEKGDRYGLDMCQSHDEDDPLVEFYDARHDHAVDPNGVQLGQFVSRYYLSTLTGKDRWNKESIFASGHGLNLDGGVPDWSIDGAGMAQAGKALIEMGALEPSQMRPSCDDTIEPS